MMSQIERVKKTKFPNLILRGLGITEIPQEVWNLTWLEALDISENPIKILPPGIGNLKNLSYFDMTDTLISEFPKEIGHIPEDCDLFIEANRSMNMRKMNDTGDIIRHYRKLLQ
jgi:internalin A